MKAAITAFLAIFLLIGWGSFLSDTAKANEKPDYGAMIEQADKWAEEGLYQRAIRNYKEALPYMESAELREKLMNAYLKRYEENTKIYSEYVDDLKAAAEVYPSNPSFAKKLLDVYLNGREYLEAYKLICAAEANGITDNSILGLKDTVRYDLSESGTVYSDFRCLNFGRYTVKIDEKWGAVNAEGDKAVDIIHDYMGPLEPNEATAVYTDEKDSRLIANGSFVLGIFDFKVQNSGYYANGLIPVQRDNTYNYYDEFAKEQFGGYDYAGSFQNGKAAIQKNNKWYIIDTQGNELTEGFDRIITDSCGNLINGSHIVAFKTAGMVTVMDKDLNTAAELKADDADVYTGELLAFKSGDKWGYADGEGNVVIKPEYEEAKSFSQGLAAVCKDGQWGFINPQNKWAIQPQFEGADYFNSEGCCMVKKDGYWQLIELTIGIV